MYRQEWIVLVDGLGGYDMKISEMIAQLEELKEKHGDLPIGAFHGMAKIWMAVRSEGVGFVPKDMHDLYSTTASNLKYECDFIGIGAY